MMGIIFDTVRSVVIEDHGEDVWDQLLAMGGVEGAYSTIGNYPHIELTKIVHAASEVLHAPVDDVWRSLGKKSFRFLRDYVPHRVDAFKDSQALFEGLQPSIHAYVNRVYPNSSPPRFDVERELGRTVVRYVSARGFCHLAEGLAAGAVEYFGETAAIKQTTCGKQEGKPCRIQITYT